MRFTSQKAIARPPEFKRREIAEKKTTQRNPREFGN